jgi:hypothetical protein
MRRPTFLRRLISDGGNDGSPGLLMIQMVRRDTFKNARYVRNLLAASLTYCTHRCSQRHGTNDSKQVVKLILMRLYNEEHAQHMDEYSEGSSVWCKKPYRSLSRDLTMSVTFFSCCATAGMTPATLTHLHRIFPNEHDMNRYSLPLFAS